MNVKSEFIGILHNVRCPQSLGNICQILISICQINLIANVQKNELQSTNGIITICVRQLFQEGWFCKCDRRIVEYKRKLVVPETRIRYVFMYMTTYVLNVMSENCTTIVRVIKKRTIPSTRQQPYLLHRFNLFENHI